MDAPHEQLLIDAVRSLPELRDLAIIDHDEQVVACHAYDTTSQQRVTVLIGSGDGPVNELPVGTDTTTHPNLATVLRRGTIGAGNDYCVIVGVGSTLADEIASRGGLAQDEVVTIVADLADATAWLHRNGFIAGAIASHLLAHSPGGRWQLSRARRGTDIERDVAELGSLLRELLGPGHDRADLADLVERAVALPPTIDAAGLRDGLRESFGLVPLIEGIPKSFGSTPSEGGTPPSAVGDADETVVAPIISEPFSALHPHGDTAAPTVGDPDKTIAAPAFPDPVPDAGGVTTEDDRYRSAEVSAAENEDKDTAVSRPVPPAAAPVVAQEVALAGTVAPDDVIPDTSRSIAITSLKRGPHTRRPVMLLVAALVASLALAGTVYAMQRNEATEAGSATNTTPPSAPPTAVTSGASSTADSSTSTTAPLIIDDNALNSARLRSGRIQGTLLQTGCNLDAECERLTTFVFDAAIACADGECTIEHNHSARPVPVARDGAVIQARGGLEESWFTCRGADSPRQRWLLTITPTEASYEADEFVITEATVVLRFVSAGQICEGTNVRWEATLQVA